MNVDLKIKKIPNVFVQFVIIIGKIEGNMNDLPVWELVEKANKLLENPNVEIYFKFTCGFCGSRQTFSEKNLLFQEGIMN